MSYVAEPEVHRIVLPRSGTPTLCTFNVGLYARPTFVDVNPEGRYLNAGQQGWTEENPGSPFNGGGKYKLEVSGDDDGVTSATVTATLDDMSFAADYYVPQWELQENTFAGGIGISFGNTFRNQFTGELTSGNVHNYGSDSSAYNVGNECQINSIRADMYWHEETALCLGAGNGVDFGVAATINTYYPDPDVTKDPWVGFNTSTGDYTYSTSGGGSFTGSDPMGDIPITCGGTVVQADAANFKTRMSQGALFKPVDGFWLYQKLVTAFPAGFPVLTRAQFDAKVSGGYTYQFQTFAEYRSACSIMAQFRAKFYSLPYQGETFYEPGKLYGGYVKGSLIELNATRDTTFTGFATSFLAPWNRPVSGTLDIMPLSSLYNPFSAQASSWIA